MDQALNPALLQRRNRRRLLIAAGTLAGSCLAAWGINRVVGPSVAQSELVLATVHPGDLANTINASGVVIPMHEELVSSPVQTRVAKVLAKAGQQVAAGDVLLQLDDRALRLAIDGLQQQLAQQQNAIAGLTLEMNQKHKQLASAIELLELDLRTAQVKWSRFQVYKGTDAISKDDMLAAELNVQRHEIQLRQQRELIEDSRRSTLSAIAQATLQKNIYQKQLEQQQQLLAQTQVRAPFSGMLTWLAADEGASVANGQLLARVSELGNYGVEATLSDFHARALQAGQPVRVEQGNLVLAGKVQTILPEIQNGSVKLLVALEQPGHPALRNKLRVDVNIVTEQKTGTLVADTGPAINGRGRQAVFVLKNGVARKTELDIGGSDGKAVEILAGAVAGEQLVVSDITRFKDLDSIRVSN
jgi:HlyD family secretion protein